MLKNTLRSASPLLLLPVALCGCSDAGGLAGEVEHFAVHEVVFEASTAEGNPYVDIEAEAVLQRPGGGTWRIPLFWDGGTTWKMRVSPDAEGEWLYRIDSNDSALAGQAGRVVCVTSDRAGGLQVMWQYPSHFARQNGDAVWFMGDTAWGYFTDSDEDNHHREQAEHYARTRASQGFNVIHSMMMSEQGVGNNGGLPFHSVEQETINPGYWQEVDERVTFANEQGLTVGMVIAWGDKRGEPFAWGRFRNLNARKRYARYIAARYSAYDVYYLVSGEWNFEVRARRDSQTPEEVFQEFVAIGEALDKADPHARMIGIHPSTAHGGVREFRTADWMSFADYQQNYSALHERLLISGRLPAPAVNSEYGYYLRDQDGDGRPDKSNSFSAEDMRFASWDIVTAGGYLVTGFGSTYFGGHRDPGPFDVDAAKNDDWEAQIGYLRGFFTRLEWWKLISADELIESAQPRGEDRVVEVTRSGRTRSLQRPPRTTYWAMSAPGETYVLYARGLRRPLRLTLDARAGDFSVKQFNPRTGEYTGLKAAAISTAYEYTPPDEQDWVVLLERLEPGR